MTGPLLPELAVIVDPPGSGPLPSSRRNRQTKQSPVVDLERTRCEIMRGQLEADRSTFIDHWRELGSYILPRRPRFTITDVNQGGRRTKHIIDSTATSAAQTLSAGMMSGITSPARPWFKLETPDPALNDKATVKDWLYEVRRRMNSVFLKSNLYNVLPILYGDMGVFGTSAMTVEEDDETVVRFYPYPIGSYVIQNDEKGRVRTFGRTFRLTVLQIVQRWGNMRHGVPDFMDPARAADSKISLVCQRMWRADLRSQYLDIAHLIYPNFAYNSSQLESKYKRFKSVYYEYAAPSALLLEEKGFDEFPVLCPRWVVNAEDAYATGCPGMTALGDIKQLQVTEKRISQAIEKQVNPPVKGPTALRTSTVSTLPGGITYVDELTSKASLSPVYQVQFEIEEAEKKQEQCRARIERVFFADLFLMLTDMDRKEITATEIMERKEEKLLALGPVLEQLNQDLLDPLIDRVFAIMLRRGLLPPVPPELSGVDLRVEYTSIMAQAQKMIGIANMERFVSFLASLSQAVITSDTNPEVFDNVDIDNIIEDYAEATGISPRSIKSEDMVQAIRNARQKAQQAAQAAQQAESISKSAKNLSGADMSGDNALTRLAGRRTAANTLNGTNAPPASVAGGVPLPAGSPT